MCLHRYSQKHLSLNSQSNQKRLSLSSLNNRKYLMGQSSQSNPMCQHHYNQKHHYNQTQLEDPNMQFQLEWVFDQFQIEYKYSLHQDIQPYHLGHILNLRNTVLAKDNFHPLHQSSHSHQSPNNLSIRFFQSSQSNLKQ